MNTVKEFIDATGYNRGPNYPSKKTLKAKMQELDVTEEAKIDSMSFLLYDDNPVTVTSYDDDMGAAWKVVNCEGEDIDTGFESTADAEMWARDNGYKIEN